MPFGPDLFGEMFETIAGATKSAVKSTAGSVKSQTIGGNNSNIGGGSADMNSGFGGTDFSSLQSYEQNVIKQQQQNMLSKLGQNQSPSSALSQLAGNDKQGGADQATLMRQKQVLQQHLQTHRAKYYLPTFEQGPMKIRQEREQRYQAKMQQEEQKKQQMQAIEEKKKQDQVAATMRTRREGEGAKITG